MKRLPDTELEVMKALWAAGEDTPRAVLEQALEPFGWATNTVNTYLTRLEKKGFIEFRSDPRDKRCKRIFLCEKGRMCTDTMHQTILSNEEKMVQGFSEEEKAQFAHLLSRAIENMGGNPCRHKKEESHD